MLDTDSASYVMRRSSPALLQRLRSRPVADACISVITESELRFGIEMSPRRSRDEEALEDFLRYVTILPFTSASAKQYALIRADLKRKGTLIGPNDLFIAAHALAEDCVLVTNNVREFSRVSGLKIENWVQEEPVN